jgi:hypothetical protein
VTRVVRLMKQVEFTSEDQDEILGYMNELSHARDGWINVLPEKDAAESTGTLGFLTLFGGGNSGITMFTWKPEPEDPQAVRRDSLGITHATGRRVAASLTIPENWRVQQDHPQRGLVLSIPDEEPHTQVLDWALRTLAALSPFARAGSWRADIYLPSDS